MKSLAGLELPPLGWGSVFAKRTGMSHGSHRQSSITFFTLGNPAPFLAPKRIRTSISSSGG